MVWRVDIGVLGPLRVTVNAREVRLPAKQQVLLAVLALDQRTVSAERLMTALWGEDVSPTAMRTLQSHVFQLRRALAAGAAEPPAGADGAELPHMPPSDGLAIETDGRGYRLRVEPDAIDAHRFERLVLAARQRASADPRDAVAVLTEALASWRGQEVADVGGESGATAEAERLLELRHAAFDESVRLRMSQGDMAGVIPELRRELRGYPYREPLWGSLMRALDASGRKAEALLAYREATETLRRELDVEPDDDLRALADQIRDDARDRPDGARDRFVEKPGSTVSDAAAGMVAVVDAESATIAPAEPAEPPKARPLSWRVRSRGRGRHSILLPAALAGAVVLMVLLTVAISGLMPTTGVGPGDSARDTTLTGGVATDGVVRLDAQGDEAIATALERRPGDIAFGAGSLWVGSPTDGTVLRIDPDSWDIIQRIHVGGGPAGIAAGFDAIWVADSDDQSVTRIDPTTDGIVASVEVGTAPEGVATDTRWVWVADRLDHALTRIDPTDGSARSFALGGTPLGVAVAAGWVWVVDGGDSNVLQVDPTSGTVVRTIAVGSDPTAIAASPDGSALWVANTGSGTVFRIDTASSTVTAAQAVGQAPTGIAVDAEHVWVAVSGADQVVRLDPTTAMITGTTSMRGSPLSLVLTDAGVAVTTGATASSHRGGTLRVLVSGDLPNTADPSYSEWYWAGIWTLTNDGLVAQARVSGPGGLTVVPDLAAAVPEARDGDRTWTFHLQPGLHYSDGRPIRASDALGSFERAVVAGNRAETGAGMFRDTGIVGSAACGSVPPCDLSAGITTDDATGSITFHLTSPEPDFPGTIIGVPILPTGTPQTVAQEPLVATGPYMVASFEPGVREALVRNPEFRGRPHDAHGDGNVDEIDFQATNDPDPATAILEDSADVLLIGTEPAGRLAQIATHVPAQLHITPANQTWMEAMNTTLPPFDDVRVRQAVSLATDRAAAVEAWGGPLTATVTCQVVVPGSAGFQRYCPWTVDPGVNGNWLGPDVPRAQALIDAAGVRGEAVTVWGIDDSGQHAAVARYFTALLTSLGFRATTQLVDIDHYFSLINDHPEQVQMAGYWEENPSRTAAESIQGAFTCPSYPGFVYNGEPSQWCDPSLDAQAQAAAALETTDAIAADEAWARIDRTIVDAAPAVMAFNPTAATLLSARTGGYESHLVLGVLYDQLWVR